METITPETDEQITEIRFNEDGIERMPISRFSRQAYLSYSMYVIMDRALPHIGDGLKPVQRRIVYAMSELGLKASAKHKKSARTIGDVLGKYHPHGDSACYEAMVLMAQPFSYRYPLIDGQGNWGAPDDPKSFAAMRYTEARLSHFAEVLLAETGMGTVDWGPNFDGTLDEPLTLPARLPNVLLNGGTGIAVGMATDIPPHNIREVADACIRLLDTPETDLETICRIVKGPDFPTGAEIITAKADIREIYRSGRGVMRLRATYVLENGDIVVTALPHQVSPAKIMEQVATQMAAKKLPMVADIRDEADHEDPTRIVIVPRSNRVDKDVLMTHLFATTDLERSFRVNLNMIGLDKKPRVKGLREILKEWLEYRINTVKRRLRFRLDKVLERLHILDGLMIVYLNLDEVIRIIRENDEPRPVLVKRFDLTHTQAEAILQLRLRHLAKLEEMKIREEKFTLSDERDAIEKTLASGKRLKNLVKREIQRDASAHGDARRTAIIEREEARAIKEEELAPAEPVTVVLSKNGWVRAAKGHEVDPFRLPYKSGDEYLDRAQGKSNQPVVFLDTAGRVYTVPAHVFPSARGYGEPLTGRLTLPAEARMTAILMGGSDDRFIISSDAGYGFVARFEDFITRNQKGKALLSLPKGAKPLTPASVSTPAMESLAVATNEGRLLIFPVESLPALSRGKGNKMIHIPPKRAAQRIELVTHLAVLPESAVLKVHAGKRHYNLNASLTADYTGERGRRGKLLPRGFRNIHRLEVILSEKARRGDEPLHNINDVDG